MTTGILLIAAGHKNYGQLAGTLAMSLRANGCELPICIAHTPETLSRLDENYLSFFTQFVELKPHQYTLNGETCYIKTKAHINEITPFDNTLFLDVDIIMINNGMINTILKELETVDFAVKNSGFTLFDSPDIKEDSQQWANLLEVKEKFGFTNEKIWNVHSEFIWWKKTDANNNLFLKWIENFENIRVKNIEFADCIPDELPLWISMCQTGHAPHKENFHPTFWPMDSAAPKRLKDLKDTYCGISIGGNNIGEHQKNNYDILVSLYARMMNLRQKFQCQPKKRWLPERHTY